MTMKLIAITLQGAKEKSPILIQIIFYFVCRVYVFYCVMCVCESVLLYLPSHMLN